MYPQQFFGLFPPFPRKLQVFVAMSFDERYRKRWTDVIEPAVGRIEAGDVRLKAFRVDTRKISDSILTEILQGISESTAIVADISTIGVLDGRAVRNANVMYEVGLAHATRLPEEVLLFRSDSDPLPFDTASTRVMMYDPDRDTAGAQDAVHAALLASLNELTLRRHLAIQLAADRLTPVAYIMLAMVAAGGATHPMPRTLGSIAGSIATIDALKDLLAIGAIRSSIKPLTDHQLEILKSTQGNPPDDPEPFSYSVTTFGIELVGEVAARMGITSPIGTPSLE